MNITLIPVDEINRGLYRHLSISEAAATLGISESTIRSAAKRKGVRRISGRTVHGGILIEAGGIPVCITYSE